MRRTVIQAIGVGRHFSSKAVLKDLNFKIEGGAIATLHGENGSGKTTLLKIMNTSLAPSYGDLLINGISVNSDINKIKPNIGWAPASDQGFIPRFSGEDNLIFFGGLRGQPRKSTMKDIEPWRAFLSFEAALKTPFYLCSSGMKQVLNLARAYLTNPQFILLDEPTRNLDDASIQALQTILLNKPKWQTVVYSTHQKLLGSIDQAINLRPHC